MKYWVCNCGRQMPTSLTNCPHCGALQPGPPAPTQPTAAEPYAYSLLVKRYRSAYRSAQLVGMAGYLGAGTGLVLAASGLGSRAGGLLLVGGVGLFMVRHQRSPGVFC